MTLNSIIESLFPKKGDKVEKMFSPKEIISAKAAYMKAKYGEDMTQTDILHNFMMSCRRMIESRLEAGHFMGTIEVDDNIIELLPKLKAYYESVGYGVIVLSPTSRIYNQDGTMSGEMEMVKTKIGTTMLLLMWSDVQISDHIAGTAPANKESEKDNANTNETENVEDGAGNDTAK